MNNKTITISASRLRCYKDCPRRYELSYLEGLQPEEKAEALQIGSEYHEGVEKYLNGEITESDNYLVQAFIDHIDISDWEDIETEVEFYDSLAHGIRLYGFLDGKLTRKNKRFLLEHKTVSYNSKIDEQYELDLQWDDQTPLYSGATGIYNVLYTVVKKCGYKQKQSESDEEFYNRRREWYNVDTEKKIRCFAFRIPEGSVVKHRAEVVEIAKQMRKQKVFYKNRNACSRFGGCQHRGYCLTHTPGEIPFGCVKKGE